MTWWSVLIETKATDETVNAEIDAALDELAALLADAAPAVGGDKRGWSIRLSVATDDAPWNAADATNAALGRVIEMADKAGLPRWPVVRLEATEESTLDAELQTPNFPDVLGTTEVCKALNVSRQRLHELRTTGRFPAPMVELAATPLWLRTTVDAFLKGWERKPGRPAARSAL